ncbi:MAG: hypothetical protein H6707_02390 [Deltaproteobacteria bacterium]|nr:hypothetical protein [Deltaproteobacteria bacterium]
MIADRRCFATSQLFALNCIICFADFGCTGAAQRTAPNGLVLQSGEITAAADRERVVCFAGNDIVFSDGRRKKSGGTLIQRRYLPAQAQIHDLVVDTDPAPGAGRRTFRVAIDIDLENGRFVAEEVGGNFKGQGALIGPPWSWTRWRGSYRLKDGTRIETEERYDAGGVVVKNVLFGPDGKQTLSYAERFRRLSDRECAQRFPE